MALYSAQDHRGITVRLHSVVADVPPTVDPDAGPADVRRRIEAAFRPAFAPRSTIAHLVPVVGGALSAAAIALILHRWFGLAIGWVIGGSAAASLVSSIVAAAAMRRRHHHVRAAAVIAAFLAERRCPGCGYDLTGCHPEADARTVCPECAAAWRLAAERAPGASPG
jgi:hypothetical protein